MMADDSALLRLYTEKKSEDAFSELVRRHIGLVFNVALRKVGGDAHLAHDVAQTVFTDLARKADSLCERTTVTGWLFTSTHFAAAKAVRAAQRRRKHEAEAHAMKDLLSPNEPEPDWDGLRPVLDDLIRELPERDREAVLLRFFEGHEFAHIGAKLRLSADGARSRVERALEKIRRALERRGIESTAGAVGLALASQASAAAVPAGLASSVTSAALAGASAGAGAATGMLALLTTSKLTTGVIGALAITSAVGVFHQSRANADLRAEMAALRQQTGLLETVRADHVRLTRAASELETLRVATAEFASVRREASELRQRNAELSAQLSRQSEMTAAHPSTEGRNALAPGMLPAEAWRNVGHATPEAAFQTLLWAAMGGDLELIARSLHLTEEVRAKADALFARLPGTLRTQFGTTEQMVASFLSSDVPFAGMKVEGAEFQDQNRILLDTQWQYVDGRVQQNPLLFVRGSNGSWSQVLAPRILEKWDAMLRSGQIPSAARSQK